MRDMRFWVGGLVLCLFGWTILGSGTEVPNVFPEVKFHRSYCQPNAITGRIAVDQGRA